MTSYYDILGVTRDCSDAELRAAYRARAVELHPDKYAQAPSDEQSKATRQFQEVTEAYAALSTPAKRANYDAKLNGSRTAVRATDPSANLISTALDAAQALALPATGAVDSSKAIRAVESAAHLQLPAAKRVFGLGQTPAECYSLVAFEALSMAMREITRRTPKDTRSRAVLDYQAQVAKLAQQHLTTHTSGSALTGLSGWPRPRG